MTTHDPITAPDYYTVYPVQPIHITRHLSFCLGNAVKYVLRAPYKDGAQDLRKALEYLRYEEDSPAPMLTVAAYKIVEKACEVLISFLSREDESKDRLPAEEDEIWGLQADFLVMLDGYLESGELLYLESMRRQAEALLACLERGGR